MTVTSHPTGADCPATESPLQVEIHRAQKIATDCQNILDRIGSLVDRTIGAEPSAPALVEKTHSVQQIGGKVGEIQELHTNALSTQRSIIELLIRLEQNL